MEQVTLGFLTLYTLVDLCLQARHQLNQSLWKHLIQYPWKHFIQDFRNIFLCSIKGTLAFILNIDLVVLELLWLVVLVLTLVRIYVLGGELRCRGRGVDGCLLGIVVALEWSSGRFGTRCDIIEGRVFALVLLGQRRHGHGVIGSNPRRVFRLGLCFVAILA